MSNLTKGQNQTQSGICCIAS